MTKNNTDIRIENEPLPHELWGDLTELDPQSNYLKESLAAANDLAEELGFRLLTLEDVFPPVEIEAPAGYSSELVVPNGLRFDATDLSERIQGFNTDKKSVDITVHRLVTDAGIEVHYCDVRPFMSERVQKSKIRRHNQAKINTNFYIDMKRLAENASGRKNIVEGVDGAYYSRVQGKKARRYWANVTPEGSNIRTFAILGENPDDTNAQKAIYRQIFGIKMT